MSSDAQQTRGAGPLSLRLIQAPGIEPLWLGLGVGLVLVALVLGYEASLGHLAAVLSGDVPSVAMRAPIVAMLLIGLAPAGMYYQATWTEANLALLARDIDGEVDSESQAARPSRLAGALTGVGFALLFVSPDQNVAGFALGETPLVHQIYPWFMVGALGWLIGRLLHAVVMDARAVSRLAGRLRAVDLFDTEVAAPFVQQGQRSALLMIVLFSVTSVLALAPGDFVAGTIFVSILSTVLAVTSLVLPVQGVRKRIRAEKQTQLGELRSRIDAIRADVFANSADAEAVGSLPGLIALEARIASVRELPFDTSNLLRVGTYVLIGLGSWVGAAAVERLLDWSLR